MLAPDVDQTQKQLQQQVSAAEVVSQYTQAVSTLIPAYAAAITDPSLQKTVNTVESDAQTWPNSLCAAYTQQVPGLFTGFNTRFAASAGALSADAQTLLGNPSDQAAKSDILERLQTLLSQLRALGQPVDALQTQLKTFEQTVQNDHTLIANALDQLAQSVPHGTTIIQSVQASLGLSFFSAQQLSPCIAIVEIDSNVALKVTQVGAGAPEVIPIVLAQALLTALKQNNEQAASALSAILDTWQALIAKYEAVIQQITQAQSSQLGGIIQQLDIQTATLAWQQLAQFAGQLTTSGNG